MSPSRKRGLRLAVVLLFAASGAVAGACGATSYSVLPETEGGMESGSVVAVDCGTTVPENGGECLLPEGTTCDFGRCGTRLARCSGSRWQVGSNAPPKPQCPKDPPNTDVSCPPCWAPEVSCPYGSTDCSAADASINTAIAWCRDGRRWVLDIRPCRDGGGPDVQGDGGPDAD